MKDTRPTLCVIGNGMVGHRFCTALQDRGGIDRFRVVVFGDEPRPAYDRVRMSEYFTARDPEVLALTNTDWYAENGFELRLGERITTLDPVAHAVTTQAGETLRYDHLVLATGSAAFVPPVFATEKKGVFVYRTIEDLDAIIGYADKCKTAAVIGGGLLGLEAAKAVSDLGLKTRVIEFSPRLMPRQLDDAGAAILRAEIESRGVEVLTAHNTQTILGNGSVTGLHFEGNDPIDADMVVVSAGIKPRDELARAAGITVGQRGGVLVDDTLATETPDVFAIGEVACHGGMVYGLVAPGYEMADVLADRLTGGDRTFTGADLSTKLKLLGVEVASFGDPFRDGDDTTTVALHDPVGGTYKKVVLDRAGDRVIGGILVGDTSPFALFQHHARTGDPITKPPLELLGVGGAAADVGALPDSAQVCSCNAVTKGAISAAVRAGECRTPGDLKACTKAGTGCGGCMPAVTDLLHAELKDLGITVKKTVCEHFQMSRQELFHAVKVQRLKTYPEVLKAVGTGGGCEVCKPAVASILASLWNDHVTEHDVIQDTNDRFLANIQRGGTYSVIPRVPGGEITPEKLVVLGEVAKKYDLYCKITGGQRIDLLGARVEQLPEIWEELVAAGFESGHAYGKAVRTVKSCVGSTWCRFGVQDSTSFAIRIEERYRGIRAPHKLKFAVSGCVRECAEAQCKDVGLIATEAGWNIYVCGNGGAKPRHADLLVSDVDEETAIRYIDRFLMYYIHTADPLNRTSTWLEKLEGGLDQVKDVVLQDSLGICETLEADMARLVDTYACEWKRVVDNPELRARFTHFANEDEGDPGIQFVRERGQKCPAPWPEKPREPKPLNGAPRSWFKAGRVETFPRDGGMAIDKEGVQVAVFHHGATDRWYATQNMCPHREEMVLARGLLGEKGGTPKVACPLHKKQFSLESGECLTGEDLSIETFDVKVEDGFVYVRLPAADVMRARMQKHSCTSAC
jgi:nitrite reductase (NADH) large subunit